MLNKILAATAALSIDFVPSISMAQHISSTVNPITLTGPASLGSANCTLTLIVYLGDSHGHAPPLYNLITAITGTNTGPYPCPDIEITGGTGSIGAGGAVTINYLDLDTPLGPCTTGSLLATASNVGLNVNVILPATATVCGVVSANLTSTTPAALVP